MKYRVSYNNFNGVREHHISDVRFSEIDMSAFRKYLSLVKKGKNHEYAALRKLFEAYGLYRSAWLGINDKVIIH